MVSNNYFSLLIVAILGVNCVTCAEFVPLYVWGTAKLPEQVPALHKISEDSFKDTLLEGLKSNPYIIVFAEHTLSPEDFAQRDQAGEIAFPNILNLKESTSVIYTPYVQNPIGAIKQLDKGVTELSIKSLLTNPNVPKDNILIVDLNDARDDEHRFHMLKRHDSDIISIYKDIAEQHDNILAIYTAHHTSWVAPEEVMHKKSRSLLEDEADDDPQDPSLFQTSDVLLYLSAPGSAEGDDKNIVITSKTFTPTSVWEGSNLTVTLKGEGDQASNEITFRIEVGESGYWALQTITLNKNETEPAGIYAPLKFSYHCEDLQVSLQGYTMKLPGFQIQPYQNISSGNNTFGDAYDCVGFTSVPIWSGLFVTAILLLIMTFGLTMMMDIKTMDRFDDAKGKTITINAVE